MEGKSIIITGAGSGFGKAMAHSFCAEKCNVVLADINEDRLQRVYDELFAKGGNCIVQKTDVSSFEEVESLINRCKSQYGSVDVMINNAGIGPKNLIHTAASTLEDWDRVIAVNQSGVFYGMKAALTEMLKQGYGNIINVASLAGLKASVNNISYAASKFAVVGMTKAAAMEYGRKNIRINALCPGYSKSALLDSMFKYKPEIEDTLRNMIPFKRFGEASEIADAAVWLASDKSSYITGQTITLDGGLSL